MLRKLDNQKIIARLDRNMSPTWQQCIEYQEVANYYGTHCAKRSGVPLINHIDEGCRILQWIGARYAIPGYCLHPLYQNDLEMNTVGKDYTERAKDKWESILHALDYREIANAYLSHHPYPVDGIYVGCPTVAEMLRADKIQNRKDFEKYHINTHPNTVRLQQYFKEWLDALGVDETLYQEIAKRL